MGAATWHSAHLPSPDSRRFMNRCAVNPMKSTESFTFSDASWDSYSAVSPTRTITWMSRTGTDRFVGTTGTIPEYDIDVDGIQSSSSTVFRTHGEPMVGGIIKDALDHHMQACDEGAFEESRQSTPLYQSFHST